MENSENPFKVPPTKNERRRAAGRGRKLGDAGAINEGVSSIGDVKRGKHKSDGIEGNAIPQREMPGTKPLDYGAFGQITPEEQSEAMKREAERRNPTRQTEPDRPIPKREIPGNSTVQTDAREISPTEQQEAIEQEADFRKRPMEFNNEDLKAMSRDELRERSVQIDKQAIREVDEYLKGMPERIAAKAEENRIKAEEKKAEEEQKREEKELAEAESVYDNNGGKWSFWKSLKKSFGKTVFGMWEENLEARERRKFLEEQRRKKAEQAHSWEQDKAA